jgi:glyoxylase-like metal-dependent hydrolase (beta-lactamase superfamily II)
VININTFVFNPFQENTYILSDNSGECVIVDAGCYFEEEFKQLFNFISSNKLIPVKLLNTHGHIDHILGVPRLSEFYNLAPEFHKDEMFLVKNAVEQGKLFGLNYNPVLKTEARLEEGSMINFGHSQLKVLHVPGHTKGSVAFVSESDNFIITGDVLFKGSIGRTDLPGEGDYNTLLKSIKNKLLVYNDEVLIFPGHGPSSTIGKERNTNPFLV